MAKPAVLMTKAGAVAMRDDLDPTARKIEQVAEATEGHTEDHHLETADLVRIIIVALASAAVWFHLWEPFPRISIIGLTAALIGMYPILKEHSKQSPPDA